MLEETKNNGTDIFAALLEQAQRNEEFSAKEKKEKRKKYNDMLKQPDAETNQYLKFMKELRQNITKDLEDDVMIQLAIVEKKKLSHLLSPADFKEMDALQLAAFFCGDARVIGGIVRLQPNMMWKQRSGEFKGQTVLHIVIVRENIDGARCLLDNEKMQGKGHGLSLLSVKATGSIFESTVMMGELPLSVAALTCNWDMVELLIEKGAQIWRSNSLGDTVFHSLVRFTDLHPDKLEGIKDMMLRLHEEADEGLQRIDAQVRDVWLIENKEGLTPLKLAAQLGQHELFKLILNLEGVYRHLDVSDCLFDSVFYDITEVDPVASRRRVKAIEKKKKKRREPEPSQMLENTARTPNQYDVRTKAEKREAVKEQRNISVMEIICEKDPDKQLFEIISMDVIREMIALKWKSYHARFIVWAVLHLLFMSLLSAYTVYRSKIIGDELKVAQTGGGEKTFVTAVASITLLTPVVFIPLEVLMKFGRKQPLKPMLLHHNGTYRLALITFSLLLAADAIWFLVPGSSQNYILVLALLVGWWFMTFFLRPYKRFSFFTVMLQKIFVGDLLRFCVVIFLMWIAFSVAMHSAYLATSDNDPPQEFQTIWQSALTMFQLVIGMADSAAVLGINDKMDLSSGKIDPVVNFKGLAVFLYVVFVLITYVLMLNALIAMMSNTCTSVSEDRDIQWQYQRLSVVLMLENMTPTCGSCMKLCGDKKEVKRFDLKFQRTYTEQRFFLKVKTATNRLPTQSFHGLGLLAAFVKQQRFMDKTPFDSGNGGKEEKLARGDKTKVTIVLSADMAAAALLQAVRGGKGKQPDGDKTETAGVSDTSEEDDDTLVTALVDHAQKLMADEKLKQLSARKTAGKTSPSQHSPAKSYRLEDRADREATHLRPVGEKTQPRSRSRASRSVAPMPEVYTIAPKFDTQGESTL